MRKQPVVQHVPRDPNGVNVYHVTWEIQVVARLPEEAAILAQLAMEDPNKTTLFEVRALTSPVSTIIDVDELDDGYCARVRRSTP